MSRANRERPHSQLRLGLGTHLLLAPAFLLGIVIIWANAALLNAWAILASFIWVTVVLSVGPLLLKATFLNKTLRALLVFLLPWVIFAIVSPWLIPG